MHNKKNRLCATTDIPDNGSKSLIITHENKRCDLFAVKRGGEIFVYHNHCPHTGASLNWQPDVFMDRDNEYIQCAIHGARFEVKTGVCIWGPCVSQRLTKADIIIEDSIVYLQ